MTFVSLEFLFFFPIIIGINYLLKNKTRMVFLFLSSFYFYMTFAYKYSFALIIVILLSYFISLLFNYGNSALFRRIVLWTGILSVLGILFYFKYFGFFVENLILIGVPLNVNASSPFFFVGISYIAFQIIAYFIDLYYRRIDVEKSFLVYAVFIAFLPKILSGPIERGSGFLQQLKTETEFDYRIILQGLKMYIWGFFVKVVISDRLSVAVNNLYSSPSDYSGLPAIVAIIFYSFQLYTDFMGYSFMAVGISKMLGFDLIINFRIPFFSQSISEFWRRWHISLSAWLRDYIFLPLSSFFISRISGVKFLTKRSEFLTYSFSTFVTMGICGIWHGAKWTFIIWGLMHAFYMIFSFGTRKFRKKIFKKTGLKNNNGYIITLRILLNFLLITFAFVIFRADDMNSLFSVLNSLFGDGTNGISGLFRNSADLIISFVSVPALIFFEYYQFRKAGNLSENNISEIINVPIMIILVVLIILLGKFGESDFIYFKF